MEVVRAPVELGTEMMARVLSPLDTLLFDLILVVSPRNTSNASDPYNNETAFEDVQRDASGLSDPVDAPIDATRLGDIILMNHSVKLRSDTSVCCRNEYCFGEPLNHLLSPLEHREPAAAAAAAHETCVRSLVGTAPCSCLLPR